MTLDVTIEERDKGVDGYADGRFRPNGFYVDIDSRLRNKVPEIMLDLSDSSHVVDTLYSSHLKNGLNPNGSELT